MAENKLCPKWAKTMLSQSLGRCKAPIAVGWLCEKSYAKKYYQGCPFFKGSELTKGG